jgi:ArsR family transcriptional regulator
VYNNRIRIFKYIDMDSLPMEPELQREIRLLHAEMCQALADPKRIALLYTLNKGRQCVTDLAEALGVPQPTVSYHLKILRERGLATAEPEGATVYYSLADGRIIEALDLLRAMLADVLAQQADLVREAEQS